MKKEQNNIAIENESIDTNKMEMQFIRIEQVKSLLETIGSAVFYAPDDISEKNVYDSLSVAAEELERVRDDLYQLVFGYKPQTER